MCDMQPNNGSSRVRTKREDPPRGAIFAWNDEVVLEKASSSNALALVARAVCLLEALDDLALEIEGHSTCWTLHGVAGALNTLIKAGEWEEATELLTGLEALIRPSQRAKWALDELAEYD